jgi:hypothetical protein
VPRGHPGNADVVARFDAMVENIDQNVGRLMAPAMSGRCMARKPRTTTAASGRLSSPIGPRGSKPAPTATASPNSTGGVPQRGRPRPGLEAGPSLGLRRAEDADRYASGTLRGRRRSDREDESDQDASRHGEAAVSRLRPVVPDRCFHPARQLCPAPHHHRHRP